MILKLHSNNPKHFTLIDYNIYLIYLKNGFLLSYLNASGSGLIFISLFRTIT